MTVALKYTSEQGKAELDELRRDINAGAALDSATKCRKPNQYTVKVFADLLEVVRHGTTNSAHGVGDHERVARKTVTGWSRKSRTNLLRKMARIRNLSDGWFAHLTYPAEFPHPREAKKDLKRLLERLVYHYPDAGIIWKMEPQQRGAPHFHIIVFNMNRMGVEHRDFAAWLNEAWHDIVWSNDRPKGSRKIDHMRHGTLATIINNRKAAMQYAAKYTSKDTDYFRCEDTGEPLEVGRWWGTWGNIDLSPAYTVTMTQQQYTQLRRLAAAFVRSKGYHEYARMIKRMPREFGMSVLGLGDLSQGLGYHACTIDDMIDHAIDLAT